MSRASENRFLVFFRSFVVCVDCHAVLGDTLRYFKIVDCVDLKIKKHGKVGLDDFFENLVLKLCFFDFYSVWNNLRMSSLHSDSH